MVTDAFRKELVGLSPYQLTEAVKEYMNHHDVRLNLSFAYACKTKDQLEEGQEDCLWLKKTTWKDYTQKKINDTEYVPLK